MPAGVVVTPSCVYAPRMLHDCHGWRCEAHPDQEWPHPGCDSVGMLCVDTACAFGRDNIPFVVRKWRQEADQITANIAESAHNVTAAALRRQADELEGSLDYR
jgi:hypothetical protein